MGIRSFIAVDPSDEVANRLADFVRRLSKETKGFRWLEPHALHLTLRFLGDVEEKVLKSVDEGLKIVSSETSPIALQVRGVGFFPSVQRPRVVWAGLEGEVEKLSNLQALVEEVLKGFPVHEEEKRPFTPHLTLARAKDPQAAVGVAKILQHGKGADFGEFTVRSLILYKSRLTPQGSEYSKLEEFNFKE